MSVGGGTQVVVFGSLHYDIMVEAPTLPRRGETVAGHGWAPKCGGKGGNQAVAAAVAGAATAMVGAVGCDAFGDALLANLTGAGVDIRCVRRVAEAGTGLSVAISEAAGDYGAVIASGANLALGGADVAAAAALILEAAVLVLQNEVPDAANAAAAGVARRAGATVVLNAAPARALSPALAALVDVLVVNAVEAEMLGASAGIGGLADALAAARSLSRNFPTAVVTAGGHGVAAAGTGIDEVALPAIAVAVRSTHGAGDAFIGQLAACLARSLPLAAALAEANDAAARLISR